jgi:tRNA(fMet)-specific endonuclease VapC
MSRKFILDTNALGDFIDHRRGVSNRATALAKSGYRIGTCPPVIGELYFGIFNSDSPQRNIRQATRGLRQLVIWPYDQRAAEEFGRIAAHLKAVGRPMQIVDMQLAAIAIVMDCTVVTSDSDLSAVPGLSVEDWTKSPTP